MPPNFFLYIIFFLFSNIVSAQLFRVPVGNYKNKSAQAMAIYADTAYIFNDGGLCRAHSLNEEKIFKEFALSSSQYNNHVNGASFGIMKLEGCYLPLLYTSEFRGKGRCFVEAIYPDSIKQVQTIMAYNEGYEVNVGVWTIDRNDNHLYSITKHSNLPKKNGLPPVVITCYNLPVSLNQFEVKLTEKDVVSTFVVYFKNGLQDATIKDGRMYVATGLQQSQSHKENSRRAIQVIDLEKKELLKTIDLTYLTTNEPEGIDFHGEKLLLFCGQEGGIYEIKNYK